MRKKLVYLTLALAALAAAQTGVAPVPSAEAAACIQICCPPPSTQCFTCCRRPCPRPYCP
jgi:hypothetical protein